MKEKRQIEGKEWMKEKWKKEKNEIRQSLFEEEEKKRRKKREKGGRQRMKGVNKNDKA